MVLTLEVADVTSGDRTKESGHRKILVAVAEMQVLLHRHRGAAAAEGDQNDQPLPDAAHDDAGALHPAHTLEVRTSCLVMPQKTPLGPTA